MNNCTLEEIFTRLERMETMLRGLVPAVSTGEILTRAEAQAYVKRPSKSAFHDWTKANGIRPFNRGRYSRTQLDLALQREARRRAA